MLLYPGEIAGGAMDKTVDVSDETNTVFLILQIIGAHRGAADANRREAVHWESLWSEDVALG